MLEVKRMEFREHILAYLWVEPVNEYSILHGCGVEPLNEYSILHGCGVECSNWRASEASETLSGLFNRESRI